MGFGIFVGCLYLQVTSKLKRHQNTTENNIEMKSRPYKNLYGTSLSLIAIAFCFIPILMFGQATNNPGETTDLPDDPQHPMYGLNLYIPAWDEDYETNLNWYGSGDVDGNDTINMADYNSTVTGTDPFNDGTHREDTDMDGDSGDADDKAIIMNYINGGITHINRWEMESITQKESHLEKALAFDPTSEIAAGSSGWFCGNYSNQTAIINFNGVYDIEHEKNAIQVDTLNSKDGSKDWTNASRHWHVTPTRDTIVSFKNKKQANEFRENQEQQMNSKNVTDLVYDVTDPSFGLVPFRPGNDTLPLFDDIAVKNKANKIIKLESDIELNEVDEIDPGTSGWVCDQYATQTATIDFFGVYDIYNSTLSSGEPLEFDFATNGESENPSYFVTTTTTSGVPHAICGNFVGADNLEDNDPREFDQWYFWEPQTDEEVTPGDYSMDEDNPIQIKWYGYYWNEPQQIWKYGNRNILKYDLTGGVPSITFESPDLTTSWTPFDQVTYPNDSLHEFPGDTSVAVNGEPGNLYTGTVYSHSDVSTQTNDTTCTDVTYNVTRSWEGVAGDYNSSNTPEAAHEQNIDVEDTTPPTADFPNDTTIEYYVGIEDVLNPSLFGGPTNIQDNSALPVDSTMVENNGQVMDGSCDQVNFVYSHEWEVGDVCSNNLNHSINAYAEDNTAPVRDGNGNWADNSGLEVLVTTDTISTQNPDPESCEHYTYSFYLNEYAEDVCGNNDEFQHETETVTNEAPYRVPDTPVPNNDTIYVPLGGDIHPDSIGWAEWIDPEEGPITKSYEDELIEEDEIHRLYRRTQIAEDPCQSSTDTAVHFIYEHKTIGVEERITPANLIVYPNPTNGDFSILWNKTGEVKIGIYNLQGQLIKETNYKNPTKTSIIKMSIPVQTKGIYILKIHGADGTSETVKVLKKE